MKTRILLGLIMILFSVNRNHAQCISGDCQNGVGTFEWDSGDEYTGEFIGGVRTGLGVYDWKDGSYYYGYFKDGKLEGKGVYLGNDADKTTLVGYFEDGKLSEKDNFVQTGCILGNCQDGVGVYLWDSDDVFLGEWKSGARTGYGRYDWKDGSFYTGYFKDGKLDGRGYYQSADGKKVMDGYFEDNSFVKSATGAATTVTNTEAAQPSSTSSNTEATTYNDVCSLLQTVIKSMPDDFADVTGTMKDNYIITDWNSTVKLLGSDEAELLSGFSNTSTPDMWYNTVYSSASFSDAQGKYKSYIAQFKACPNTCCSFTSSVSNNDTSKTYTTSFTVSKVNSGYSSDYNDLEVAVELKYDYGSTNWQVELQVYNDAEY